MGYCKWIGLLGRDFEIDHEACVIRQGLRLLKTKWNLGALRHKPYPVAIASDDFALVPLDQPPRFAHGRGHIWSYDLVEGRTHDGRKFRFLSIIDEASRECLAPPVAQRLRSEDVLAARHHHASPSPCPACRAR